MREPSHDITVMQCGRWMGKNIPGKTSETLRAEAGVKLWLRYSRSSNQQNWLESGIQPAVLLTRQERCDTLRLL